MSAVKSSSIKDVHHDPATSILAVEFHNGKTYRYEGVSADQAAKLKGADSIGRHFMSHIRGTFNIAKGS